MLFEKKLFYLKTDRITIDICLGFEGDNLVLDGYDIGKVVEEHWGDSDYEYQITVKKKHLDKLYEINNLKNGQKKELVEAIAKKINGNRSYSLLQEYLTKNDIEFESFTWS